jgi:predicted dehydrogenase
VVGVMGTSRDPKGGDGRGSHLAATLATLPGVHVAYVCDVDQRNVPKAIESVSKQLRDGLALPKGVGDFRRILDDRDVDALVVATPDHWHAPAAILACSAGKHVYVEKPCSHNAREGELLVQATRKHNRIVQHGTQRRTWPGIREAIDRLRGGDIGRVISARSFYWNDRPTIGRGMQAPVPPWLDWSMWQGPAPQREFHNNFLHYNWHWFWHWGTGELGNNGVHYLDLARWGLGVDYPTHVSYTGGKLRYDDDQETPDTAMATYEFGDQFMTWEQRSWAAQTPLDPSYEVMFAGEKGYMTIQGNGYTILDRKGKKVSEGSGKSGDAIHLQNFVDAIRGEATLNAPIEEGYKSALLCHLGNIAYRVGHVVNFDPGKRTIKDDPRAAALWGREYRSGWEPKV